jgi:hypothetical protein
MADLIARLDVAIHALLELRAELLSERDNCPVQIAKAELEALAGPPPAAEDAVGDFADSSLLDTTAAAARFGYPRDTIASWCRQGDGVKIGGRWLASVPRLRRRLNGRP